MTENRLKVVIDTSVFIAALLSKNPTSAAVRIVDCWSNGQYTLVTSPQLLMELVVVLSRRGVSAKKLQDLVAAIAKTSLFIPGAYEATRLDHIDPNDNMFLAAAYEAKANYLVSLDTQSLLPIKYYHGTQILSPAQFLDVLN
ncbi:putative toxin-antitoxin system toxin component, PIN family [Iningainema tapete]|uniref:Putative toxin-antitoxin system toxin component, PIN family n=1 Tax=Iningainema tapete BLCC-T55 TaxID=2748662 RepID=A0A8J6XTX1_9CYAN|nr:putative toxin-antitoxin system toxin component, PIN family [Iningainema tapete BLCC-T55]